MSGEPKSDSQREKTTPAGVAYVKIELLNSAYKLLSLIEPIA